MSHKEIKTNAMRILDRAKIPYQLCTYDCNEFVDGVTVADQLGQDYEATFKTLVTQGKSGGYYVFVIPVHRELDLKKASRVVGEKSLEMLPVKEIQQVSGYIRGGCTAIGMKKQYPTIIHESARQQEHIAVSGGRRGTQIILTSQDLAEVTDGVFGDVIKS
ncbi:MAG: Cys-tRNA(Pro) deacylase [Lachnospiraceae bacterium]|nr:Cys-tRNA(Pro) deacylase [Lachnospiraceae bacterium]